ncbi:MAG: hypothetical protein KDD38_03850 [Bdellovibrionales bacterium]|nr:hypothetical protein [Bdellovibrionales bacterium]
MTLTKAHAGELFEVHSNARAMGMGGAFAALVEDEESLWYNPAGIAKNGGIFWTIADPKVGLTDPTTALGIFSDLGSQSTFESALTDLGNAPIWIGASAKTSLIMPFFAAAYFYDVDVSMLSENPVSPSLTTNYIMDTGVALGTGWTMGGMLQVGFAAKYITRSGVRKDWGTQEIADIIAGTSSPDVIFDSFTQTTGVGYGFDFGMNIIVPTMVQPTVSFVWKNVGNTTFRAGLGEEAPPTEMQDMLVGASLLIDLPLIQIAPALEVRHLNDGDVQIGNKIHMGVEMGLPLIDLRAGLYQGYYTYGVGLNLGILKIDAASWGVELGGYPGQFESRRYMVQASINIGFDMGFGTGGSNGNSASSSGEGGKSGSGGGLFSGRRKMKQRR